MVYTDVKSEKNDYVVRADGARSVDGVAGAAGYAVASEHPTKLTEHDNNVYHFKVGWLGSNCNFYPQEDTPVVGSVDT